MIETKMAECSASTKNIVISDFQAFGWEVKETQVLDYVDNKFFLGGFLFGLGVVSGATIGQRIKYVSITFQRNTNMNNYLLLKSLFNSYVQLEKQIYNVKDVYKKTKIDIVVLSVGIVLSVIMFILAALNNRQLGPVITFLILGFVFLIVAFVGYIVINLHTNKCNKKMVLNNKQKRKELRKKQLELVAEGRLLLK